MDLKQLRAFLMVADTGSVTRAADMLNLVQPAVSRQIRLLEGDIGTTLFDREPHGMTLTEAGKVLVGYARRALEELERARIEVSGTVNNRVSGLVTLGLLPSTVNLLSNALVSAMATAYPEVRVRIAVGYAGTLMQWMASGEVDAALIYGSERSSSIQTMALVEDSLWVIGPPESKLDPKRPVTLSQLASHKLVLPSAPHGIRTLVDHACAAADITLNLSAETSDLDVQRSLVLGGHGLTVLPTIAVAEDLRVGRLRGAPLSKPGINRTIMLALSTHRATTRHIRCAVELLTGEVKRAISVGAWRGGRWLGR